jgi:hypothetical protein
MNSRSPIVWSKEDINAEFADTMKTLRPSLPPTLSELLAYPQQTDVLNLKTSLEQFVIPTIIVPVDSLSTTSVFVFPLQLVWRIVLPSTSLEPDAAYALVGTHSKTEVD